VQCFLLNTPSHLQVLYSNEQCHFVQITFKQGWQEHASFAARGGTLNSARGLPSHSFTAWVLRRCTHLLWKAMPLEAMS
jgi:hypothetical protein